MCVDSSMVPLQQSLVLLIISIISMLVYPIVELLFLREMDTLKMITIALHTISIIMSVGICW